MKVQIKEQSRQMSVCTPYGNRWLQVRDRQLQVWLSVLMPAELVAKSSRPQKGQYRKKVDTFLFRSPVEPFPFSDFLWLCLREAFVRSAREYIDGQRILLQPVTGDFERVFKKKLQCSVAELEAELVMVALEDAGEE